MAKRIFDVGNGMLTLDEEGGDFTLALNASAQLGGGQAAGVVSAEGSGKLVLKGKAAFDLGMKLLEAHSPAALVPLEQGAAAIVDGVIGQA